MLHLLQTTVSPHLGLRQCVETWFRISCLLREPPRRRALQIEEIELN
jgi:hypothetical protein